MTLKQPFSDSLYLKAHKILWLIVSFALIALFFYMDHSENLKQTLIKVDEHATNYGLLFYAVAGIIQFGSLLIGITIFLTLTYSFIKRKSNT